MPNSEWWDRFWNEPMRDNPWTWLAFILFGALVLAIFVGVDHLRHRRDRRALREAIDRIGRRDDAEDA